MKTKLFILISLLLLGNGFVFAQEDNRDSTEKQEENINWRKVKIVDKKNNVMGMKEIQDIKATAKGNGQRYQTPESLENSARLILRKRAAQLNANYILLTDKSVDVAFGENPSVTVFGVAYTDKEEPESKETEDKEKEDEDTKKEGSEDQEAEEEEDK